MKKISAKIIADSVNPFEDRLTTFVLTFPRIVLAEFNTHRMFSRNSASSRAIPFKRMLEMVDEDPFIPIGWMKDHKGMQGKEFFKGYAERILRKDWIMAKTTAVRAAKELHGIGLTKQITNRLLEPFMWHTVIMTTSQPGLENFFDLRAHPAAEIHIAQLAYEMKSAYATSEPKKLLPGEWHIPFGDRIDEERLPIREEAYHTEETLKEHLDFLKVQIATARCARVSYMNFEGKDDYEADLNLYDRLKESGHFSPFEHCALAHNNGVETPGMEGNFGFGWIQLRKTIEYE